MSSGHGGDIFRISGERGWDWRDVLDFSANINPLGPAPGVEEAIRNAICRIRHYPAPESGVLADTLASRWNIAPECLLTGNGATELLHFFARVARPGGVTLIVPSFSEFHRAFPKAAFAHWDDVESWPTSGFVALTNPNNPLGAPAHTDFEDWLRSTSHTVMVDESFLDFTDAPSVTRFLQHRRRLYVLRSLTKFHAIPGLRLGALVAGKSEMAALRRAREPWQVNVLAEEAAIASLADAKYAIETRCFVMQERAWLAAALGQLPGVHVQPSCVNFLYVKLDYDPAPLCDFLLARKILLRDCSRWIGFEQPAVRVAVRTRQENERLFAAWSLFSCAH